MENHSKHCFLSVHHKKSPKEKYTQARPGLKLKFPQMKIRDCVENNFN